MTETRTVAAAPAGRAGVMLAALVRFCADLALITIAIILGLSAAGAVTLH